MAGVLTTTDFKTIRLQGIASTANKTAEVLTGGGVQGVALIDGDLIAEWLEVIIAKTYIS